MGSANNLEAGQAQVLRSGSKAIGIVLAVVMMLSGLAVPAQGGAISVPAELVEELRLPGQDDSFSRPRDIYFDHWTNELYISDPGHNRVLIFDENKVLRFEFTGMGHFSMALDISVNSHGYIYLLVSTKDGYQVQKFDFDGRYISTLDLGRITGNNESHIESIAIDDQDRLYLHDSRTHTIHVIDPEHQPLHQFKIVTEMEEAERLTLIVGDLCIDGDKLYFPMSVLGVVKVYALDGRFIRDLGYRGETPGSLNAPTRVAVTSDGMILVLNKMRFNVVCFSPDYQFLGEFGGKGFRLGWFYFPTIMSVDNSNQVIIGQIYKNFVQVCSIPDFITEKLEVMATPVTSEPQGDDIVSVDLSDQITLGR